MTTTSIRPLVAGNWKMNGLSEALGEAETIRDAVATLGESAPSVLICPPATLIAALAARTGRSALRVGAQDCHWEPSGAYTGDISAEMVRDAGGSAVIVGHSERRTGHSELDRIVRAKAAAAHRAGLLAIVCIGETKGQREAGLTLDIVRRQLVASLPESATAENTVIAYEPVWAIGTGLTPSLSDVTEVHAAIRRELTSRLGDAGRRVAILYGGSVNPGNAGELLSLPEVGGALVGGASLRAEDFLAIIRAATREPRGALA